MANSFDSSELIDIPVELYESFATALEKVADKMDAVSFASEAAAKGVGMLNEAVGETTIDIAKIAKDSNDYNAVLAEMSKQLSTLNNGLASIEQTMKGYQSALQGANVATRKGREETDNYALRVMRLTTVYQQLGLQVDDMQGAIQALAKREKDYQRVMSAAEQLRSSRIAGLKEEQQTYNSNSQQYTILKALVNELTEAEREGNMAAKEAVEMARKRMEVMNQMQIATGKYSLQVGNYSKAMNGLSFSMAQVVRETPSLFNSVQQFAMAISNNIPILVDNIRSYSDANRKAKQELETLTAKGLSQAQAMEQMGARALNLTSTTKALAASLLSLNTIVVAITLAFQLVAKAIDKKKKAQKEANEATKEAITLEKMLADASLAVQKKAAEESSKLKTLYSISQDVNRSMTERVKSANILKDTYKEQLQNYSAEEIALGKAKSAYDSLTESVEKNAEAMAYFDEIKKLYTQKIAQKAILSEAEANQQLAEAERDSAQASLDSYNAKIAEGKAVSTSGQEYQFYGNRIKAADNKLKEAEDAVSKAKKAVEETDKAIVQLGKDLPVAFLETDKTAEATTKAVGKVAELKDYYWEAQLAIAETIQDGYERRREIARVELNKDIAELEAAGEKDKSQWDNILTIMASRYKAYFDELAKITKEENDAIGKEIDTAYAEQNKAAFTQRENRYNLEVAETKNTIKNKKELFDTLKEMEIQYWKDVLVIALAQGNSEKIAEANAKILEATAKVYSQKRRRSNAPKNLIETIFAGTSKFGADNPDGGGRMVQSDYQDLVSMINSNIQTSIQYMNEWMSTRIEMAQVAVEAAQKEVEASKNTLDAEITARANGYASNVEMARQEWQEKKKLEREAVAEQKRLQKIQEAINTAQQVSSLITATAGLWAGSAPLGIAAPGWAIASTALMWSSFLASKAAAIKLMNTENYGEGMSEYLDYGGSHASGNDIDFGVKKDGTRRRVERGEMIAVINKRNVRKYGANNISDIISSLNKGTFGTQYGNTYASMPLGGATADLSTLEGDVRAIKEQGEKRVTFVNGKRIETYKNSTKFFS